MGWCWTPQRTFKLQNISDGITIGRHNQKNLILLYFSCSIRTIHMLAYNIQNVIMLWQFTNFYWILVECVYTSASKVEFLIYIRWLTSAICLEKWSWLFFCLKLRNNTICIVFSRCHKECVCWLMMSICILYSRLDALLLVSRLIKGVTTLASSPQSTWSFFNITKGHKR